MTTLAILAVAAAVACMIAFAKSRRAPLYRDLTSRIARLAASYQPDVGSLASRTLPAFDARIALVDNALPAETIDRLANEAKRLAGAERSFIPTHKKGGTVAYETLFEQAPSLVGFYHSDAMREVVSRLTGVAVSPTPIHDQSSLSVLFYDRPGDHIGWHYDHNFYRGRHFTVLLPVINEGSGPGGLSHATLKARIGGREVDVATPPNTLVVFEGARVSHKVTPIIAGERRLVISMTYCTDSRANMLQGAIRRVKDVAFFGPRALWT